MEMYHPRRYFVFKDWPPMFIEISIMILFLVLGLRLLRAVGHFLSGRGKAMVQVPLFRVLPVLIFHVEHQGRPAGGMPGVGIGALRTRWVVRRIFKIQRSTRYETFRPR